MFFARSEQLPRQSANRATWVVGLINWNSKLGTHRVEMTHLDCCGETSRSFKTFIYPMAISCGNESSTWRRRNPVPCRELFRLFSMNTINWYVRLARREPPTITNEDFGDCWTPSYLHNKDPCTTDETRDQLKRSLRTLFTRTIVQTRRIVRIDTRVIQRN